jgi:hypothetical protein
VKRSDWALVVLIVAVVGIASYFIVSAIVPPPNKNLEKVETASAISTNIATPSTSVFKSGAINPTVKVHIGDQSDQIPFSLSNDNS